MRRGSLTDGSGTITTGGTSQQVFAANPARRYLFIQNQSNGNLWVNFGAAAVEGQPSILLLPNGSLEMAEIFVSTDSVNIIGATAGQAFAAKQA